MQLFSRHQTLVKLGSITLGLALACSGENKEQGDDAKEDDSEAVVAKDLDPGKQQCAEGDQGRVCVMSESSADAGPEPSADAGSSSPPTNISVPVDAQTSIDSDAAAQTPGLIDAGAQTVPWGSDATSEDAGTHDTSTEQPTSLDGGDTVDAPVAECSVIRGTVRDFRRGDQTGGHPDFETRMGTGEKGLVKAKLSKQGRPAFANKTKSSISSAASFSQWYEDVPGVNAPFRISLQLEQEDGFQVFGTTQFFPLDELGFGDEALGHNFGFTTELHAHFLFAGGGSFQLAGDDDLWLFVNGQLVIDLGGVHGWQSHTIQLADIAETLGLLPGNVYALDIFHAERHSTESKLLAKTDLVLVDCE